MTGEPEGLDVAFSGATRAVEPAPEASGSVEVAFSGAHKAASDGTPVAVPSLDSAPVSSGRVAVAVTAGEGTGRRSQRLTDAAKDAIGGGVTTAGNVIGTLGEGVTYLGEKSKKVPIVGSSVSMLGEGLTSVGESLTELPRVAATRRGRLMLRSMIVGFLLVGAWIAVIVALQVRGTDAPDFRPNAAEILSALSGGPESIEAVYEGASPRFQEMVRKERFVADMTDLDATVGKFREITAVNDTLVTTGPTGRVGRVALTVAYEKGKCKASVSLHADEGEWKLLGIGVELPSEIKVSQAEREERVQACKYPMDPKRCDVFVAANAILEQLRDGQAGTVWDAATQVFQKQEERSRFIQIQKEHAETLGAYRRIIAVTEAKAFGGTNATYDVLVEYERSQGVRATFSFYRRSRGNPWKLRSLKIVLPMPRADDAVATPPDELPPPADGSAGSGLAPERP